jgi:NTP pyrophosphatase (non-canonical NTP hydrolase)
VFPNDMRTIEDFQAFHQWLDEQKAFDQDIFFNMVLLMGEVGEVAEVLRQVRKKATRLQNEQHVVPDEAMHNALSEYHEELGSELADCLAYIFKLANYTGVDLQEAYLRKMLKNIDRTWRTASG